MSNEFCWFYIKWIEIHPRFGPYPMSQGGFRNWQDVLKKCQETARIEDVSAFSIYCISGQTEELICEQRYFYDKLIFSEMLI